MFSNLPCGDENFPTWALGGTLSQLAYCIQQESGTSISAISTALFGAFSLACQGRVEVEKCTGLVVPTSQWFLLSLPSGERKTAIIDKVLKPIRAFVAEKCVEAQAANALYEGELKAWQAQNKGLTDAIRKKTANGGDVQIEQARLNEVALKKPIKPKKWRLVHEIASAPALLKNLSECHPSTSIVSDEASVIFDGQLMHVMGTLNRAYDGSDIFSDTVTGGEVAVVSPSLTLLLFTQPEAVQKFLHNRGDIAKGLGWIARCFSVAPPITAGYKFSSNTTLLSNSVFDHYEARIREILEDHVDPATGEFKPKHKLRFTPEAQARWNNELDSIEVQMRPDGCFCNEKAFAAKLADKMARMAAVLHHFESDALEIPLITLNRAIAICTWYANEYLRLFSKHAVLTKDQLNANALLKWLARHVMATNGMLLVKKNDVLKSGPTGTRDKVNLDIALQMLWQQGCLCLKQFDGKKTLWVELSQNFFTPAQVQQLAWQS